MQWTRPLLDTLRSFFTVFEQKQRQRISGTIMTILIKVKTHLKKVNCIFILLKYAELLKVLYFCPLCLCVALHQGHFYFFEVIYMFYLLYLSDIIIIYELYESFWTGCGCMQAITNLETTNINHCLSAECSTDWWIDRSALIKTSSKLPVD